MDKHDSDPIHGWFGLTYASYLVLPRSVLQSLPVDIQAQFVDALEAIRNHLYPAHVPVDGVYSVTLRDSQGRFMKDPLCDYERGWRRITKDDLLRMTSDS
jgi:hypothetical protein